MPRSTALARIASALAPGRRARPSLARRMRSAGLAVGLVAAGSLCPGSTHAATGAPASEPAADAPASPPADDGSTTEWGPILWACMGVGFGAALAVWQIRGMKRDGRG